MGVYKQYVLPRFIALSCGSKPIRKQREKVVPLARGRVLEIGFGSGLNLAHYDASKVDCVIGLEPDRAMLAGATEAMARSPVDVEILVEGAESIPLDAASIDTVLVTYTLCTVPDVVSALAGMRRLLKPEGSLIFCEHGKAPDASVQRWQNRLNPLWRRIGGGCNLNRDIPALLEQSGYRVDSLNTMYLPGTLRIAGFNVWGTARPA